MEARLSVKLTRAGNSARVAPGAGRKHGRDWTHTKCICTAVITVRIAAVIGLTDPRQLLFTGLSSGQKRQSGLEAVSLCHIWNDEAAECRHPHQCEFIPQQTVFDCEGIRCGLLPSELKRFAVNSVGHCLSHRSLFQGITGCRFQAKILSRHHFITTHLATDLEAKSVSNSQLNLSWCCRFLGLVRESVL